MDRLGGREHQLWPCSSSWARSFGPPSPNPSSPSERYRSTPARRDQHVRVTVPVRSTNRSSGRPSDVRTVTNARNGPQPRSRVRSLNRAVSAAESDEVEARHRRGQAAAGARPPARLGRAARRPQWTEPAVAELAVEPGATLLVSSPDMPPHHRGDPSVRGAVQPYRQVGERGGRAYKWSSISVRCRTAPTVATNSPRNAPSAPRRKPCCVTD